MAVKNLQTVALCVAKDRGVRVTGTESKYMMGYGMFPTPILSLPRLPRLYPSMADLADAVDLDSQSESATLADNAAAAQAVLRAGRSGRGSDTHLARSCERSWQRA